MGYIKVPIIVVWLRALTALLPSSVVSKKCFRVREEAKIILVEPMRDLSFNSDVSTLISLTVETAVVYMVVLLECSTAVPVNLLAMVNGLWTGRPCFGCAEEGLPAVHSQEEINLHKPCIPGLHKKRGKKLEISHKSMKLSLRLIGFPL
jgi:hypothetical protein